MKSPLSSKAKTGLTDSNGPGTDEDDGKMIAVSPLYPNDAILQVIGEFSFIARFSPLYQKWSIFDLGRVFEPPIFLKQFKVYKANGVPRGVVTWAKLNPSAEVQHLSGKGLPGIENWRSGDQMWIMDIIAPWKHGRHIIEDIKANVPENTVKTLRIHKGKKKILEWWREGRQDKWKIRSHNV